MRISVIQSRKPADYDPSAPGEYNLDRCRSLAQEAMEEGFRLMRSAAAGGADLIVTTEAFNASILLADSRYDLAQVTESIDGPIVRRLQAFARESGIYVVSGLYLSRAGKVYNTALLLSRDGVILGTYEKVHLPAEERRFLSAGSEYKVYETEFGTIAPLICWDLQYPEAAREVALRGADLVVCPTQGWENIYGLCRAYENSFTIAAAMRAECDGSIHPDCDPSCIVDNMGKVLAAASRNGVQVVTADVDIRKDPAPQYGSQQWTGLTSMRQTRLMQRRPETYTTIASADPPLSKRYERPGGR